MPRFLERILRKEYGGKKSGRALDRIVYGSLNNMGAMHGNKETAKGRAMDKKHAKDTKRG